MAAGELRSLGVLARELVADVVEQLDVALLGVLLQGCYEGPRHGTRRLSSNRRVGPVVRGVEVRKPNYMESIKERIDTHDVWSSLLPESMITSAGDVLVRRARLWASSPLVAFLKKPMPFLIMPLMSPWL